MSAVDTPEVRAALAASGKPKRDYVKDHARRTLRRLGLSKVEAKQFVKNYDCQDPSLSEFSRGLPKDYKNLTEAVYRGFLWDESPQGHAYWFAIAERVRGA